ALGSFQAATAAGSRNLGPAASVERAAATHAASSAASALCRPGPVHMALPALPAHPWCHNRRQAGYGGALASQGFAAYWWWKSRSPGGRPRIAPEVRDLIRRMSLENPLWGATKMHGELLTLASRHVIPAVHEIREFTDGGGLMSYGPNLVDGF